LEVIRILDADCGPDPEQCVHGLGLLETSLARNCQSSWTTAMSCSVELSSIQTVTSDSYKWSHYHHTHTQRWSGADLNPSSSSNHILILSSNCTLDTIVALVVHKLPHISWKSWSVRDIYLGMWPATSSTQPGHLFVGRHNEYQPKGGDALRLGSKGRYGSCVGGTWHNTSVSVIPLLHIGHIW